MDAPHRGFSSADLGVACIRPWSSVEERDVAGLHTVCCDQKHASKYVARDSLDAVAEFARGPERAAMQRSILDRTFSNCKEDCEILRAKNRAVINRFYAYDEDEYASFPEVFRRNRERVLDCIASGRTSGDSHPLWLKVHPSGRCNLRCPMCFEEKTMKPQVDPNYIARIYAAMPYLEELKVFGGEPFSCKVSREILYSEELQRHPQIHLSMVTNGSLLDEKALSLFERQRLGFISFSLDSAKPDTYERVRVRGKLDRTMAGISEFLDRRARGRIRVEDVTFSMTLQRENFSEVAHFVRFAHEHGVSPTFGLVNGFDHLLEDLPRVRESILEGIRVASSLGERDGTASLENLLQSLPGYRGYLERIRSERRRPKWMWDLFGDERMERIKTGIEDRPRVLSFAKGVLALGERRRASPGR